MLLKQIKDNIEFLVDDIFANIYMEKGEERQAIIWRNFVRRTQPYEVKFKKTLQGLFRGQEREVLSNMRRNPHPNREASIKQVFTKQNWLSDWLFAEMMWRKRFSKEARPFIGGVLEDVGQNELTNLVVGIDFDVSNPEVVAFINKNADKYSFYVNDATIDHLRKQLTAGVAAGESIPELTKRVKNVFGFAEQFRSTRIARTEIIRASNSGAEAAYMQSGVVEKKEWLTAFDERTCNIGCKELNGRTARLGKSFGKQGVRADLDYTDGDLPHPPLHPSCRCTLIAVLIE